MIDIESLRINYDCDYEKGVIYRVCAGGVRKAAGTVNQDGYTRLMVSGKMLYGHRVMWAHYYQEQPPEVIDHIDGNPRNNSIKNLRSSSPRLNQLNRKLAKNNTTGFTGVSYIERIDKYKATIYVNSNPIHLGVFDTAEEASKAYTKRKEQEIANAMV